MSAFIAASAMAANLLALGAREDASMLASHIIETAAIVGSATTAAAATAATAATFAASAAAINVANAASAASTKIAMAAETKARPYVENPADANSLLQAKIFEHWSSPKLLPATFAFAAAIAQRLKEHANCYSQAKFPLIEGKKATAKQAQSYLKISYSSMLTNLDTLMRAISKIACHHNLPSPNPLTQLFKGMRAITSLNTH